MVDTASSQRQIFRLLVVSCVQDIEYNLQGWLLHQELHPTMDTFHGQNYCQHIHSNFLCTTSAVKQCLNSSSFASFGCCKIITLKLNLSFCFGKAIHRHELTGFVQKSHFLRFLLLNSMTFTFIHLLANFQSPANCLSGLQVQGHPSHSHHTGKQIKVVYM